MKQTINLTDELYGYILDNSLRESDICFQLREETSGLEMARMQISPDQGQFMAMLVSLIGAKRIIEVGTFTGYSALVMAQALPEDGRIVCCDISEEWTAIAQRYWQQAGVSHKIELRLAPACDTLDALIKADQQSSYDFAFIDADKTSLSDYFERCLTLVRPGGVIAVDNVLWGGSVIDEADQTDDTCAIRAFNLALKQDQRVDISLVPIGDGLTLARKRH